IMYNIEGSRILVVDDNATNRRIVGLQLTSWGCEMIEAEDGYAALDTLKKQASVDAPIQLAIIDHQMPRMDGMTLAEKIKGDPGFKRIPVIMLTSVGGKQKHQKLKDLGIAAYLSKPIKQSMLYDCITTILSHDGEVEMVDEMTVITTTVLEEGKLNYAFKILIVEDNEMNQKVTSAILKKLGHGYDIANNGKEALERFFSRTYDLVLMDCQMPVMGGLEATEQIREREPENERTPIVGMTAMAMQGDRERCLESGMDDYLSKPATPDKLNSMLNKWLRGRKPKDGEEGGSEDEPFALPVDDDLEPEPDETPVFDLEHLRMMTDNDEPLMKELAGDFMNDGARHVDALLAIEAEENLDTAREHAHTLKGICANIGVKRLGDVAGQLEQKARHGEWDGFKDAMASLKSTWEAGRKAVQDGVLKT
ncbi:MAG: response regulator, partial [Verrucomicrobiota bacterium]